jgi:hypothetical protein
LLFIHDECLADDHFDLCRSGYVEEAQQTLSQSRSNVEREETGESGRRRFSEASSGNDADTFSTLEQRMASTSLKGMFL